MAIVLTVGIAIGFVLVAGLIERGFMTRVWTRASRLGRGRRYDQESQS